jgi:hypothetical protein
MNLSAEFSKRVKSSWRHFTSRDRLFEMSYLFKARLYKFKTNTRSKAMFRPKLYTNGLSWHTISWHYTFKSIIRLINLFYEFPPLSLGLVFTLIFGWFHSFWMRNCIWNADPFPGANGMRIQCGNGSWTLHLTIFIRSEKFSDVKFRDKRSYFQIKAVTWRLRIHIRAFLFDILGIRCRYLKRSTQKVPCMLLLCSYTCAQ